VKIPPKTTQQEHLYIFWLAMILGATLRLVGLGRESLWFDEGWTAFIAQLRGPILRDVLVSQPFPLYYGLLSWWNRLGQSELILRLPSALVGIASIPLLYQICRQHLYETTAALATLLFALSPMHIWYSQEARMYALGTFFVLAATWTLLNALEKQRLLWWAAYVLLFICAVYTFYYALSMILVYGIYIAYQSWQAYSSQEPSPGERTHATLGFLNGSGNLRKWLIAQGVILLISVPSFVILFQQVFQGTWSWVAAKYGQPGLGELIETFLSFSVGLTWPESPVFYWGGVLLFGLVGLFGLGGFRLTNNTLAYRLYLDHPAVLLIGYLALPIGTLFIMSQFIPGYLPRYLLLFLPPYYGLLARGVASFRPRWARWLIVSLLVLAIGISLYLYYRYPQKEEWREATQRIVSLESENDLILVLDENCLPVFEYYYQGPARVEGVPNTLVEQDEMAHLLQDVQRDQRIWLLESHTNNHLLRQYLEESPEYQLEGDWEYIGIQLALFTVLRYNM
jgi:uncharacterized membrane protein